MSNNKSFQDILVRPDLPIIEAVEVLNRAHKRIVLVTDDDMTLLGVVTDSNIRHAILDKMDLSGPVSRIMRAKPVTGRPEFSEEQLLGLMEATTCYQVPIVDADNRVVDVRFIEEVLSAERQHHVRTAVIMVGGMGTRLHPVTKTTPKPLLPVGGRPLLFTIMDQLIGAGIERIYLTLNYRGDDIREAIATEQRYAERVEFLEETKRLGTAGPLSLMPDRPTGPFVVMNGDLLTKVAIDEMLRFHGLERNVMTAALREEKFQIPYGIAQLEGTRIARMIEKPDQIHFVNAGVYVVEPYILDRIPADEFFDMTQVIDDLIANDLRVGCFPVHEYWLDIGRPEQLEQANQDFDRVFGDNKDGQET